jgi:hypothetical protein
LNHDPLAALVFDGEKQHSYPVDLLWTEPLKAKLIVSPLSEEKAGLNEAFGRCNLIVAE